MQIGPKGFWIIVIIYVISIIIFGNFASERLIIASTIDNAKFSDVLAISASSAIVTSSLFNIRKLYKDAFAGLGEYVPKTLASSATIVYFLSRPGFAMILSCLFSSVIYASIRTFSQGHVGVNGDFIFFSSISACVLAVSTGSAVTKLEDMSKSGHSFFRIPF